MNANRTLTSVLVAIIGVVKHRAGQHDQKTHRGGRRGAKSVEEPKKAKGKYFDEDPVMDAVADRSLQEVGQRTHVYAKQAEDIVRYSQHHVAGADKLNDRQVTEIVDWLRANIEDEEAVF